MKQNITEKIISKHCGKKVKAGEVVFADIDWAFVQDGTGPLTMDVIEEMGGRVSSPENRCVFLDHASPSSKYQLSDTHNKLRKYAQKRGMELFDIGEGICHQLMAENYVNPGDLVVGADSHTCTAGAFGAFASGFGSTDIAFAMSTGKLWLKVPSAIKVNLAGKLKFPSMAKDVILKIIGDLGASGATYKTLEFTGEGVGNLSMESRLTICNMVIEAGAKNGIMAPDEKVNRYIKEHRRKEIGFEKFQSDTGVKYEKEINIDLSKIAPQIAVPHGVDNVKEVKEIEKQDIPINQVLIGTCTGGRIEDLRAAAEILKDNRISSKVRMIVVPASRKVFKKANKEGLIDIFVDKGASLVTPGCGPCVGIQGGVLGTDEVCVSTANRNFKGRMGCSESFIYLSSPATAAASAVKGRITNPKEVL